MSSKNFDGSGFIKELELALISMEPLVQHVITKQLLEVQASRDYISLDEARLFVENMAQALPLFLGPTRAKEAEEIMRMKLKEFQV